MHEACCGCGAVLDGLDGPTHEYMASSPACFAAFTSLLAAEYSSRDLMNTAHRLTVDTWAVQHPGSDQDRRAVQSVGLHLARLHLQLEHPRTAVETNLVMRKFSRFRTSLRSLRPPARFRVTVAEVAPFAGTPLHVEKVRAWAEATWQDWSDHHSYIRSWIADRSSRA